MYQIRSTSTPSLWIAITARIDIIAVLGMLISRGLHYICHAPRREPIFHKLEIEEIVDPKILPKLHSNGIYASHDVMFVFEFQRAGQDGTHRARQLCRKGRASKYLAS